jgi:pimeloyl-ACP methyl ester carboxylesterase
MVSRVFALSVFIASTSVGHASATAQAATLSPGEHHATVNGVTLWYKVAGSGPYLVIQAPGWGPASEYLRNGLKPLEHDFTLIEYDPRGSGRSARPADGKRMSTSDMVDDLEQLRRFWRLDSMMLLGHSHGGAIALGYAIRYPERVRTLFLVDACVIDEPAKLADADLKRELRARRGDSRFTSAILATDHEDKVKTDEQFDAYLKQILPLYFYDPVRNGPRFARTDTGPPASIWAQNALDAADNHPMTEYARLDRITARTAILVGRADWICPVSASQRIHARVRNSQLFIIEKAGHFPWIEAAQEFFRNVVRFAFAP